MMAVVSSVLKNLVVTEYYKLERLVMTEIPQTQMVVTVLVRSSDVVIEYSNWMSNVMMET